MHFTRGEGESIYMVGSAQVLATSSKFDSPTRLCSRLTVSAFYLVNHNPYIHTLYLIATTPSTCILRHLDHWEIGTMEEFECHYIGIVYMNVGNGYYRMVCG